MNNYKTIIEPFKSEILKIKKSKFIGCVYPVETIEAIKAAMHQIKADHPSASHWCYAYSYGIENPQIKTNDDGEPSNSAGKPILGQIQAFDLSNVLVVVIRYYGGTKLGVGGLISAYKESAKLTLSSAEVVEKELTRGIILKFKYDLLNVVMRAIKQYQLEIKDQTMEMDCSIKLEIPKRIFDEVLEKFQGVFGLKVKVL
ncbi:IMPACT family protein [Winogradskyella aurantiaca]|uniref:IMPACT family protein n=1 Tax=Winogradskyella aurantiaca TaxID=2219558 RepID=UPI000E1C98BB|nr:YigZ family protein [Winogradskyella aurantiaca]